MKVKKTYTEIFEIKTICRELLDSENEMHGEHAMNLTQTLVNTQVKEDAYKEGFERLANKHAKKDDAGDPIFQRNGLPKFESIESRDAFLEELSYLDNSCSGEIEIMQIPKEAITSNPRFKIVRHLDLFLKHLATPEAKGQPKKRRKK